MTITSLERAKRRVRRQHVSWTQLLVPVDFSDCSREALAYAEELAIRFGARITVLNVLPLNEGVLRLGAGNFQLLDEQLQENYQRKLIGFIRQFSSLKTAQCMVKLGNPVEEIVRAAKDLRAAAIVISTHGLTGVKHALIGSTAEKVVRHASCPVWVVPAGTRPRNCTNGKE